MHPTIPLLAILLLAGCTAPAAAPTTREATFTLHAVTQSEWCPSLWMLDPPVDNRVLVATNTTAAHLAEHVGREVTVTYTHVTACEGHGAWLVVAASFSHEPSTRATANE